MTTPLRERLSPRCAEIEQAALARAYAIDDPTAVDDPDYVGGLRVAVSVAIGYGLEAVEPGDGNPPAVPAPLLAQARAAARNRVPLDTVLRRYMAGYVLLEDLLIDLAGNGELSVPSLELKKLLRRGASLFDRVVTSISEEYVREVESRSIDLGRRKGEKVRMLLAGEPVEADGLDYELDGWHIGAVASGPGTRAALRDLATALDRSLLLVQSDRETLWAWLGGKRKLASREIAGIAKSCWPRTAHLAFGEPGEGIGGWRLTHRQAKAAMPIAHRTDSPPLRYADVALLASALHDDILAGSLHGTYMAPLRRERDGGLTSRRTLAAYFESGRNASSAAALLGVNRKTVSARLHGVEEAIGRPIDDCAAELETALRLWQLEHRGSC